MSNVSVEIVWDCLRKEKELSVVLVCIKVLVQGKGGDESRLLRRKYT